MDEHLDGLSDLVHNILKRLKMGETGAITCTKDYPPDEVQLYITGGYGPHKNKWFDVKYDKASNVVYAQRAEIPDWTIPDEVDHEEEL